MNTSRHAIAVALIGIVGIVFAIALEARLKSIATASGYLPLVALGVGAAILYIRSRPRAKLVYARSRRRPDSIQQRQDSKF